MIILPVEKTVCDKMLAKEVNVLKNSTVIKCMTGLVADYARATNVKCIVRAQRVDMKVDHL